MWQAFDMDSAIPTMVLLQRQKIRLKPKIINIFFIFIFLHYFDYLALSLKARLIKKFLFSHENSVGLKK